MRCTINIIIVIIIMCVRSHVSLFLLLWHFIGTGADGTISHWHMTQQKPWFKIEEADNQIYCVSGHHCARTMQYAPETVVFLAQCDYRPDGDAFVTAGRDAKVLAQSA